MIDIGSLAATCDQPLIYLVGDGDDDSDGPVMAMMVLNMYV